ncbi:MAG TPA: response regulator [Chiayiivirga sp.]|nr:response regulator [Chiayiivirga sp.]
MAFKIMVVDDEPNILQAIRRSLGSKISDGNEVFDVELELFDSPVLALARAQDYKFDLVLSDYRMPEMDGVAFLKAFREAQPGAARLILSGYADLNGVIAAINEAGIFRFISKPWQEYELRAALCHALVFQRLLLENQRLADTVRAQRGVMSRQEMELRRLEQESPGITKVNWNADGSITLEDDDWDGKFE